MCCIHVKLVVYVVKISTFIATNFKRNINEEGTCSKSSCRCWSTEWKNMLNYIVDYTMTSSIYFFCLNLHAKKLTISSWGKYTYAFLQWMSLGPAFEFRIDSSVIQVKLTKISYIWDFFKSSVYTGFGLDRFRSNSSKLDRFYFYTSQNTEWC